MHKTTYTSSKEEEFQAKPEESRNVTHVIELTLESSSKKGHFLLSSIIEKTLALYDVTPIS
ncbi:hypothetical protein BJL90_08910 [Clostridium formicaceticum]|uniref:Uncharacterized protein n=1 Tax=Clostridium formicaceticum TaxID=1497 RepID=A0ABM6ET63_9CLOT|nr:hypothetical protein [Clostridium formicaceticum]AOY76006.1 hypothetical protein BJL90_08910 [Clostridium formicaceticum]